MSIIGAPNCGNCKFSKMVGAEMVCQRIPPTGHPIIAMTPQGPQMIGKLSIMPPVTPTNWCGEHVRKLVVVGSEPGGSEGDAA